MKARRMMGAVGALLLASGAAMADISIEMVPVGDPGNAGQLSGAGAGGRGPDRICGAVDYQYNIGKYEVTAGQYTAFLNAVAGVDTYELYNPQMFNTSFGSGISRGGGGTVGNPYTFTVDPAFVNRPVNYVSWGDAARFTNWLTNGQLMEPEGSRTTETGSYALNGAMTEADLMAVARVPDSARVSGKAYYFIPTEDEWYKAAYYNPAATTYFGYPTNSDTAPGTDMSDASGNNANYAPMYWQRYTTVVGNFRNSPSPYGTFDQGGNVSEWNEAIIGDSYRGVHGGSFDPNDTFQITSKNRGDFYCTYEASAGYNNIGFRVSEIPEPVSMSIFALGGLAMIRHRRRA
jgi:formylglycine-generating enzyme